MMTESHGDFIWYELMTTDADAAMQFYGPLLGWDFADPTVEGSEYRQVNKDGVGVLGFLTLGEDMISGGASPMWAGYVSVRDIDASVAQLRSLGGQVYVEPNHLEGIGHMAFVADPQGAPFYLMQPEGEGESQSFAKHAPREGHCAWNELVSADAVGAKSFYCDLFGWEKTDEMDMGEMGLYQMFSVNGYTLGAIMPKPAEMPVSAWAYYFRVPEIDAAAAYVAEHGGQVMNGPMEIPGGEYVLQGLDPQGAFMSLIGKKGA